MWDRPRQRRQLRRLYFISRRDDRGVGDAGCDSKGRRGLAPARFSYFTSRPVGTHARLARASSTGSGVTGAICRGGAPATRLPAGSRRLMLSRRGSRCRALLPRCMERSRAQLGGVGAARRRAGRSGRLGYYGRAATLHRGAAEVVRDTTGGSRTCGRAPPLPGIGRYTAAAIASMRSSARAAGRGNVARCWPPVAIDEDVNAPATQPAWTIAAISSRPDIARASTRGSWSGPGGLHAGGGPRAGLAALLPCAARAGGDP